MITRRKYSDILPEVPEGDMHEPAGLIKAAFQHDGVPVWIPPKKLAACLIGQNHPRFDRPIGCLGIDNVTVTPHNAALTRECMDRMAVHAAQRIDEVLAGRTPTWPVNQPKVK